MEVAFTEGKRNIMTFLHVLSLLVIGFTITFGTVILPGKPAPLICFWKECDGYEWRNDWTPGIPSGSCVNQHRNGHHVYVDRQGPWRLNNKIRLTMPCLSGFELYSRWVPLIY